MVSYDKGGVSDEGSSEMELFCVVQSMGRWKRAGFTKDSRQSDAGKDW